MDSSDRKQAGGSFWRSLETGASTFWPITNNEWSIMAPHVAELVTPRTCRSQAKPFCTSPAVLLGRGINWTLPRLTHLWGRRQPSPIQKHSRATLWVAVSNSPLTGIGHG